MLCCILQQLNTKNNKNKNTIINYPQLLITTTKYMLNYITKILNTSLAVF